MTQAYIKQPKLTIYVFTLFTMYIRTIIQLGVVSLNGMSCIRVKLNKTLAFNVLRFALTVIFLYYFVTGIQKLIRNEIGTKITIEDQGKSVLPQLNICPYYYSANEFAIDIKAVKELGTL